MSVTITVGKYINFQPEIEYHQDQLGNKPAQLKTDHIDAYIIGLTPSTLEHHVYGSF